MISQMVKSGQVGIKSVTQNPRVELGYCTGPPGEGPTPSRYWADLRSPTASAPGLWPRKTKCIYLRFPLGWGAPAPRPPGLRCCRLQATCARGLGSAAPLGGPAGREPPSPKGKGNHYQIPAIVQLCLCFSTVFSKCEKMWSVGLALFAGEAGVALTRSASNVGTSVTKLST